MYEGTFEAKNDQPKLQNRALVTNENAKGSLTLVESADALVLDGLLDAVHRARVHGKLPGGRLGLGLEAHLQERESKAN